MKKLVLFLISALTVYSVKTQTFNKDYLDGRLYVQFNKSALKHVLSENPRNLPINKIEVLKDFISEFGITKLVRPFAPANDDDNLPYILRIEFSKIDKVESFITKLQNINSVIYAEKIPLAKIELAPNDPQFSTVGGSVHLNQINAQNAWNLTTGNPTITVAIVDNAVMWTHPDLVANTYTNSGEIAGNGIDDDANGYVDDVNGYDVADYDNNTIPSNTSMDHGTHCAGIAAATTNNGIGVASIGWNIKFIPVKCETNTGSPLNVTYGFEGILYAVKAKAKIISCSWVNIPNVSSISEQLVINYAWNRGSIVIACAGNYSSNTPYYPASYTNVYCVAAVDLNDLKAGYSNFGSWVDISAPGSGISSTIPGAPFYVQYSGTSMATPLVAGLAGLILSKAPNMTRSNVLNCISSTAANIYTITGNTSYANGSQLGAGRIDAYQALLCASNYTALAPQANFYAFPKNTCPNTLINFYDSSNYVPNSWSWVFQGGSPATSTLTNPSVQWSTPGTYSVSLSVTNANGTNAITKLSYITVSVPSATNLPYIEGFENSTFLPLGWTEKNIQNDEIYWKRKTGLGGFGTSTACSVFDNNSYIVSGDRDEMRSPKFDLTTVVSAKLKFDVAYARFDATFSDTLEVKYSTNCGFSWTSIYLKGGTSLATAPDFNNSIFIPTATQWRKDSIDISASCAGQNNVMFSFVNRGHYGQAIYLDNINLFLPTPILSASFNTIICVASPLHFTNTSNGGTNYNWAFQNGNPSVSSLSNPTVSYSSAGNYTVSLSGNNGPVQNTITQTLTVINASNIVSSTNITNATCASCTNGSITINTSGGAGIYTYSWTPNVSTSASAINLEVGCYSIEITDLSGCKNQTVACVSFPDGLNEKTESIDGISIYPNPFVGTFNISCNNCIFDLRVFNSLAELLIEKQNAKNLVTIQMNEFPKGIYFVEIKNNHITTRKKIILN